MAGACHTHNVPSNRGVSTVAGEGQEQHGGHGPWVITTVHVGLADGVMGVGRLAHHKWRSQQALLTNGHHPSAGSLGTSEGSLKEQGPA